ncbi:hypothetical protein D3C76_1760350 [compost metagenome]
MQTGVCVLFDQLQCTYNRLVNLIIGTKIKNAENFRNHPTVMAAIGGPDDGMDFFAVSWTGMFKFFHQIL